MSKWLYLCDKAWELYEKAVKTGYWKAYLAHRKSCTECRTEER